MSGYIPIEDCIGQADGSLYKLALLAARRARQLSEGEKSLASPYDEDRPLKAPFEELVAGKIKLGKK